MAVAPAADKSAQDLVFINPFFGFGNHSLAVADKNFVSINQYWSFEKAIVLQEQIFGRILCELLRIDLSLFKQLSPFVDQSQITACVLIQKIQLICVEGLFFDIDQFELLWQYQCFHDPFASATTAQIKKKFHVLNL
jgi:hypothetical protein